MVDREIRQAFSDIVDARFRLSGEMMLEYLVLTTQYVIRDKPFTGIQEHKLMDLLERIKAVSPPAEDDVLKRVPL